MVGPVEEIGKVAGGVVDALRAQPLALANIVLNIAFLVFLFYYVSIIATRAQTTVKELFTAQDNLYKQWAVMIKDQQLLMEKSLACISIEDAMRLIQAPRFEVPLPPPRPRQPEETR